MSSIVRAARLGIGILSTLFSLLMLGLIQRQFSLWTASQEAYYLLSTGLYIIVLVILLIGVSWGVKTGEAAQRIWKATAGSITSIASFATAYYIITGIVLGGTVNSTFVALAALATMIPLWLIFFSVLTVSNRRIS